jgi:hypothetical protein|tara:strand:+ start:118 stop:1020 length:903 start_codon:yes stop_codon:yes gene_type:complete
MATYNFKNDAEVYIVHGSDTVRLDVTGEISFSQTFTDKTYPKKTLQEQHKLHEASSITKANPASFEFTIPALTQNTLDKVFNLLVDFKAGTSTLDTFDLYIKVPNDVFKLETCVITNGTFIIEKLQNLKLGIQGQASKLTRGASISTVARGTRTEQLVDYLLVSVDGLSLTEGIYKVAIELQNDIKWVPYETIHNALGVTNAATSMYPSKFTLEKRTLSGSVGQYIANTAFNVDVQTWGIGVALVIKAGASATLGFQVSLADASFTNRAGVEDVFTQTYDWKMNDNPTALGASLLKFNNI